MKIGYCSRKNDEIRCYKKTRFYCSVCSDKDRKRYCCHEFSRVNSDTMTCFMEHQNCTEKIFSRLLCLYPLYPLLYLLNSFCACFIPVIDNYLFQSLCLLWLKCLPFTLLVDCLNACDYSPVREIICTDNIHYYKIILKMGMIWWNPHPPFAYWINYLYNKWTPSSFRYLILLSVEHYVNFLRWIG